MYCKAACCKFCTYCARAFSKEGNKSRGSSLSIIQSQIKICEQCFLCHSIVLCKCCKKCSQCCLKSSCRGQTSKFLAKVAGSRRRSEGSSNSERGLYPPLPDQAKIVKSSHSCKLLWQSSQEPQTVRGITSAYSKKCYRTGKQTDLPGVLQPTIPGSQTQQQMEANPGLEQSKPFSQNRKIQDGNSGNHQNLSPTRTVGNLHRFQGCLFPRSHTGTVKEILEISRPGTDLSVQSSPLRPIHSSYGVHCHSKGGEAYGHSEGYKAPPIPRRLVGEGHIPPGLSPTYTGPSTTVPTVGLAGEHRKVGIGPQASFQLRRLPIRPPVRSGPTDTGQVAKPTGKDTRTHLPTGLFSTGTMSLIGLLTATEKQVHLGRLHMRPIQWHLKRNWRIPESLHKRIPLPRSLHPHLQWWLQEDNVLTGQPLHPLQHALQIFTDASKEGWGAHLNEHIARGSWSLPESKLHINYLELKAVFLALKEFQKVCIGKMVLVATDNTTVVAYINKEGGMRSGPLCALLWRILTWCTGKQVTLRARHIPGHLNVVADKLSRLGQTIQTEWSLLPEIFQALCDRWHQPQIDLFATRFNNKLPLFVSPVPDPRATAVDALSLSWEDLDAYAFPPTAILGKVVEKLQDSPYRRLIIIAPGWPNMAWFWDLVEMSSQIPLLLPQLPNLLTQPFNQTPHRSLTNLNLHAWLLEPQLSRSRVSLRQWQQELKLLKEDQLDPSMRQSGPFLQSGASQIRWTSGHLL